jgi:hypothetical protein
VRAFQELNRCEITLAGKVELLEGRETLVWVFTATRKEIAGVAPVFLASVKCHLGLGGHKTIESAIVWALYQLDWRIAELLRGPN